MRSVTQRTLAVSVVGVLLTGCVFARSAAAQGPNQVPTFTRDVAPILYASCVRCHRPGQVAPMSLLTYEETRPWARSIRDRVVRREMPPWHLDPTVGIKAYKDDPSLSDEQIQTIVRWVDGGAPMGNPTDLPTMPTFLSEDEWSIGEPDLIVSAPEYLVEANMADWFGSFFVNSGLKEDRWIKAIEVKPRDSRVVHHAIVYAVQDDEDELNRLASERELDGFSSRGTRLIDYAIGNLGDVYEEGTARLLKAGAQVHFAAHYHAIDEAVREQTRVAMMFYPRDYMPKHILQNKAITTGRLDIPPFAADVRHDGYFTAKQPTKFVLFQPHMHYRGKARSLEAIYPDRRVELLTYVPRFDVEWQVAYPYADLPVFPAGTTFHVTSWHDNSAANKRNPDPTNWVGWGDRTIDEMGIGHIDFVYLSDAEYQQELQSLGATQAQQQE